METRVVVAYDHHVFRQCLRARLEREDDLEVVGEGCDGTEALSEVVRSQPDLLLIDLWLRGTSGVEITRQVAALRVKTKVLILPTSCAPKSNEEFVRAGGFGLLTRDAAPEALFGAIRSIHGHEAVALPLVASLPDPVSPSSNGTDASSRKLTHREVEILQLIVNGMSGREIAESLGLSVRTVETHRAHMMTKLGVKKVATLVALAIREGRVKP